VIDPSIDKKNGLISESSGVGSSKNNRRDGVRVLAAQIRRILVDLVVQLLRNRLDPFARLRVTVGLPRNARETVDCETPAS
jgi:hypothetical protein